MISMTPSADPGIKAQWTEPQELFHRHRDTVRSEL